jgi:hypothetical protein
MRRYFGVSESKSKWPLFNHFEFLDHTTSQLLFPTLVITVLLSRPLALRHRVSCLKAKKLTRPLLSTLAEAPAHPALTGSARLRHLLSIAPLSS